MRQYVKRDFRMAFASGFDGFGNVFGYMSADSEEVWKDGDLPGACFDELGDGVGDAGLSELKEAAGELIKLTVSLVGNTLGEGAHFVV